MKISEFVIGRNVEKQTVYRYISRHEELLSQCEKDGKELEMPMEVVLELEKQYPMPKPTIVINGVPEEEHRQVLERLAKTQELIIKIQNELTDQKMLALEKDIEMRFLEDKQKKTDEEIEYLKEELNRERSKTWWQKLRGK